MTRLKKEKFHEEDGPSWNEPLGKPESGSGVT
jgi:hypothetical protein